MKKEDSPPFSCNTPLLVKDQLYFILFSIFCVLFYYILLREIIATTFFTHIMLTVVYMIGVFMLKKILMFFTLALSLVALSACGGKGDPDIVVKTKSGDITKEEFYDALKERNGDSVLQELVTFKILEDKYEVSDEEIDKQFNELKEQVGDNFEDILQMQGLTEEDVKNDIKRDLLQEAAFTEDIEVTDEEMETYYERMKTELEAHHILVFDEDTAKEVKKKLDDGEDFADIAKEYSADQFTAEAGGEVGNISAGSMPIEYEDVAYSIELDVVSDPIETDDGIYIIKITDKNDISEEVGTFEEEEENIRRAIISSKIDEQEIMEKMKRLLDEAEIDVKIDEFKDLFKEPEAVG